MVGDAGGYGRADAFLQTVSILDTAYSMDALNNSIKKYTGTLVTDENLALQRKCRLKKRGKREQRDPICSQSSKITHAKSSTVLNNTFVSKQQQFYATSISRKLSYSFSTSVGGRSLTRCCRLASGINQSMAARMPLPVLALAKYNA